MKHLPHWIPSPFTSRITRMVRWKGPLFSIKWTKPKRLCNYTCLQSSRATRICVSSTSSDTRNWQCPTSKSAWKPELRRKHTKKPSNWSAWIHRAILDYGMPLTRPVYSENTMNSRNIQRKESITILKNRSIRQRGLLSLNATRDTKLLWNSWNRYSINTRATKRL